MAKRFSLCIILAASLAVPVLAAAGEPPPADAGAKPDLEKAIAAMRRLTPSDFSKEKREAKAKEVDEAWKAISQAGPAGAARLKQEPARIDAAKEKDDHFKLGAAALLWRIGRLDEAKTIADIWSGDVDLTVNYSYVFYTAFEAARTQDPRALAMLAAVLKDKKGSVFRPQHALTIPWPATHGFLWAAYGPKGLPALHRILTTSNDPVTQESAILLLATAEYLPALPQIRKLAAEGKGGVQGRAVRSLGLYGNPEDFDFLVVGLTSRDPLLARDFAYALYEFEDLRAVPRLAPLLGTDCDELRGEVVAALGHLPTPQSIEALAMFCNAPPKASQVRKEQAVKAGVMVSDALAAMNLSLSAYARKSADEKAALAAALRRRAEEKLLLKPDDRQLTHEDLLRAAEEWMQAGRITNGTYRWVEDRHALAASTADDIDLWLQVKAKVCLRLSDECIGEMQIIDQLVRRLGRSRYRKEVGVTEKVAPPAAAAK